MVHIRSERHEKNPVVLMSELRTMAGLHTNYFWAFTMRDAADMIEAMLMASAGLDTLQTVPDHPICGVSGEPDRIINMPSPDAQPKPRLRPVIKNRARLQQSQGRRF